jgi:NAD(P)-dependent dehydrogenase (short-subunit alcohol dehydrogenase family)
MTAGARFDGCRVVVTGGGRGIGRAVVRGFAAEGARVAVMSRTTGEVADAVDEMRALGADAIAVPGDVSASRDVRAAADAVRSAWGGTDILINAAGIFDLGPTEDFDIARLRRLLDINVVGTFQCCQEFGAMMLAQGHGKIVNFGSLLSLTAFPERAGYAASKAGVLQLTRAIGVEWAARGVNVNAVAPGMIRIETPHPAALDEDALVRRIPAGRRGRPADVVGPVLFLASREADYVHAQTLVVDGGWLSYGYL